MKLFSINKVDLCKDISGFSSKMRCKWYFGNKRQGNVSETSKFKSKSTWNPPKGVPALEIEGYFIKTSRKGY